LYVELGRKCTGVKVSDMTEGCYIIYVELGTKCTGVRMSNLKEGWCYTWIPVLFVQVSMYAITGNKTSKSQMCNIRHIQLICR
jgi:hypothetical protein